MQHIVFISTVGVLELPTEEKKVDWKPVKLFTMSRHFDGINYPAMKEKKDGKNLL